MTGWGTTDNRLHLLILCHTHVETESAATKPLMKDVPLVEFMYFVFTQMPGESYRRRLRSLLLYLRYVFRTLINYIVR